MSLKPPSTYPDEGVPGSSQPQGGVERPGKEPIRASAVGVCAMRASWLALVVGALRFTLLERESWGIRVCGIGGYMRTRGLGELAVTAGIAASAAFVLALLVLAYFSKLRVKATTRQVGVAALVTVSLALVLFAFCFFAARNEPDRAASSFMNASLHSCVQPQPGM